jgi:hypothetical protein
MGQNPGDSQDKDKELNNLHKVVNHPQAGKNFLKVLEVTIRHEFG